MNSENNPAPSGSAKKLSVKILGVGGAGANALEHIAQTDLRELPCVAIHTNARVLAHAECSESLVLGLKLMRGLGTGGDPDLGKAAAEEDAAKLKALCEGADLIFIVGGLGGGTATGVAPVLARIAKETGALVLGLITLPFEFEGLRRQRQAFAGLQQLKSAADAVICLPHQKVVKLIDENTSLLEAFKIINELLAQGIRGIWQMLTRPGLIHVDFADLCSVLRGRHAESSFATVQAQGENRGREVLEKLLAHPLLEDGQTLTDADSILVSLVGGPDLTMAEVNRVMEQINRQAENAQLIVGAAITDESQGRLALTLVASRRGQPPKDVAEIVRLNDANAASETPDLESAFFNGPATPRPASRFVAPPPELSPDEARALFNQQRHASKRRRKPVSLWRQGQLPLEIVSKGRFEKSEPTVHRGEDLDTPTYIRRGVALN